MSLARALTKRYKAGLANDDAPKPLPTRAQTVKKLDRPLDRSQISLPIELLSTTNVLAYEAPDIFPTHPKSPLSASSSAGSLRSYEGSDHARSSSSSMTSPDISREASPTAPEHDVKSSYFGTNPMKPASAPSAPVTPAVSTFQEKNAPSVPRRAPSHTKKTHQSLAHKRSMRLSNKSEEAVPIPPLSPSKVSKTPSEAPAPRAEPADHPFEAELAQVKEVAEEFGVHDVCIWDEEEQWLLDNGLGKYGADDYINEIQPLVVKVFGLESTPFSPTWL